MKIGVTEVIGNHAIPIAELGKEIQVSCRDSRDHDEDNNEMVGTAKAQRNGNHVTNKSLTKEDQSVDFSFCGGVLTEGVADMGKGNKEHVGDPKEHLGRVEDLYTVDMDVDIGLDISQLIINSGMNELGEKKREDGKLVGPKLGKWKIRASDGTRFASGVDLEIHRETKIGGG
ncbi:hypothetical protein LWI28_012829 [Acer negundo]|uniref:Uncharacterized protein n=1 Tax=Acer negundo TaxID=4023 RepID=A0AAD5JQ44_ACENE|nr:hypothetical protein LWI28_012829 [Acer negundo]KAK4857445.1 hypothetical protein QYF36_000741 [Acer negundo]